MKLVYISSPLRGDDPEENIFKAICYSKWASDKGVIPLAPHAIFTQFLDDEDEIEREYGITLGLNLLLKCDELWIMGDEISKGMGDEIKTALDHAIPVKIISDSSVF